MRRVTLLSFVSALICAVALSGLARAEAAPAPTTVTVTARSDTSSIYVTGSVATTTGAHVPGVTVAIFMGDSSQGTAVTHADGAYSISYAAPAPGTYTIRVVWDGNTNYGASAAMTSVTVTPPPKAETSVSLSLDPSTVNPGTVVMLSGKLTSNGSPIGQAMLNLSTNYGDVDSTTATDSDGTYVATMAIPDADGYPEGFTVTVSFAGDNVYQESAVRASGSIVALPPVASESPAAPEATPSQAVPALTSHTTPSASMLDDTQAQEAAAKDKSSMLLLGTVIFFVALLAIGTLIIVGIISHSHKKLARDERRGFGTDFGRKS